MRRKCEEVGCEKLAMYHSTQGGKKYYRKFCWKHRRVSDKKRARDDLRAKRRRKGKDISLDDFEKFIEMPCALCGWDKCHCDIHRIIPGGEYIKNNIILLCPNCHRMVHRKIIDLTKAPLQV